MSDAEVAHRIHADGIDVLVDLAGHTQDGRLGIFLYRPAPIQATYLGYFTTTGLSTMDYWLSDAVLSPGDSPEVSSERVWRLPGCSFCYVPSPDAPEVTDRAPYEPFTLGGFNDLSKVSDEALALWVRLMSAIPEARLVLKAKQFTDPGLRNAFIASFVRSGVAADRLHLLARTPDTRSHLALYGGIDVALDTIPRTGGTTTAEALWMGVPVVTLAGDRYVDFVVLTTEKADTFEGKKKYGQSKSPFMFEAMHATPIYMRFKNTGKDPAQARLHTQFGHFTWHGAPKVAVMPKASVAPGERCEWFHLNRLV